MIANGLDIVLAVVLVSYGLAGYRHGLVVSVMSLVGFLAGGALGMWIMPELLRHWSSVDSNAVLRTVVLILGVFIIASVGQGIAVGVGAGQALSNLAGMAVGLILVRRRLGVLHLRDVIRTYVRVGVASVVAGAAAYLVLLGLGQVLYGKLYDPVSLLSGALVFAAVYVVTARRLHVREIDDLVAPVLERVRRALPGR